MNIKNSLTKMVGPLPLGVWIAVVGAGIAIMVYQRRTSSGGYSEDSTEVYNDTSGVPGVGVGGSGQWVNLTPTVESVANGSTKPTNNDEWGTLAVNRLIADGYDPSIADYAIRQYLSSQSLDSQGVALVNQALRLLGAPPSLLGAPVLKPVLVPPKPSAKPSTPKPKPPAKPAPKPVAKPATVAPTYTTYTVKKGDTIASIANRFKQTWNAIYQANRGGAMRLDGRAGSIYNTGYIAPGSVLVIPTSVSTVYNKPAKAVGYTTHRVAPGETMASIAKRYRIAWQELYNANANGVRRADGSLGNITSTANLKPGTILIIPKRG